MNLPPLRFLLLGAIIALISLAFALLVGSLYMDLAFKFGGGP